MIVLALDTTTRAGSVAVADDERVLAVVEGDARRTHGERLPAEIAAALTAAGLAADRLDLLAVAHGPGGFTGLRIGLAVIQGLAMTLGKPVVGVSALDALAAQVDADGIDFAAPWMDAQRGDVFAALVAPASGAGAVEHRAQVVVEPPVVESPANVIERWRARLAGRRVVFVGDAAARDRALIDAAGAGQWTVQAPRPLAPDIARLGLRLAAQGFAGPPHALAPLYVRRPDAEIERERRGRP